MGGYGTVWGGEEWARGERGKHCRERSLCLRNNETVPGGHSPYGGEHSLSYLNVQSLCCEPETNVIVCANWDRKQVLTTLWKESKE